MIISFVQTKGGTGKSTLALNLAFAKAFHQQFASIALVEFDPQGTLHSWWLERESLQSSESIVSFHHISSTQKEVIQDSLHSIATHNTLLILDTPGESVGKLHTKLACALSDLVVIPMRSSTNDEAALANHLLPIIQEMLQRHPNKRGCFQILPVFVNPRTRLQTVVDYFNEILPKELNCLPALYPFRAIYENFNRDGMHLYDYAQQNKANLRISQSAEKAILDIDRIAQALLSFAPN